LISKKTPDRSGVFYLLAEFCALYAGGPLLVLAYRKAWVLFLLLWLGGLLCASASRDARPRPIPSLSTMIRRLALIAPFKLSVVLMLIPAKPTTEDLKARSEIRGILRRFLFLGSLLAMAVWWFQPAQFLALPRNQPLLWVLIMVLYPLLSVWPQEVIYRRFMFHRYAPVFGESNNMVIASAVAFGFAHIIFLNVVALVLTGLGGVLFATGYMRHRSLRFACYEHALYGCLIFTLGLGPYFYTGAAWHR
jgi:hypothetical protein